MLRLPAGLVPIEIKLTATPTLKHAEVLTRFKALAGKDASPLGVLVCRTRERIPLPDGNLALPWQDFPGWLRDAIEAA